MQTKRSKGIKNSLKIFILTVSVCVMLFFVPFILLQFNKVQNFTVDILTNELSKTFQTEISIGQVQYRFFNKLTINDLYIEDQQQDTLVYAQEITAGFKFWQFFQQKIIFSHISANQLFANIQADETGNTNVDFILQNIAWNRSEILEFRLTKLQIDQAKLYYTKQSQANHDDKFNPYHLRFFNINSEISISHFNKDSIQASILHFNAVEKSGFVIKNLHAQAEGTPRHIRFPSFDIAFPSSDIQLNNMAIRIENTKDSVQIADKIRFDIPVRDAKIALFDLYAFFPEFSESHGILNLDASIHGQLSNLHFQNVKATYGSTFIMDADFDVNGLPDIETSFVYGQIKKLQVKANELQDFIFKMGNKPFLLPKQFNQLGMLNYTGNITGFFTDIVAYGDLKTNIGDISSDIALKYDGLTGNLSYKGGLQTNAFSLGTLFSDSTLGDIAITLETTGTKKYNQPLKGSIQAALSKLEFNQYLYENAEFEGVYDGSGFNGNIQIKDENIEADFTGMIDFRNPDMPVFDFELTLQNTNLYALHIIDRYPDARLSFHGKTSISGNSLDNLNGQLFLENILFSHQHETLQGGNIIFTSRTGTDNTHFSIQSNYMNGTFAGDFKYSSIGNTFRKILANYVPTLAANEYETYTPNKVQIDIDINNTNEISQILSLPYELEGNTFIRGKIDESLNQVDFRAVSEAIKTEKQFFEDLSVRLENENGNLQLTGRTLMHNKNADLLNVFLSAAAADDSVATRLIWQNNEAVTNAGEVSTTTFFSKANQKLEARTVFHPTQVIISDSIWDIRSSDVHFIADSVLLVNNFLFESKNQFFTINGTNSTNKKDSLLVSMQELNLDYLMQLVHLRGISFGGLITGDVVISGLLQEPVYMGDVFVEDFALNDSVVADATLTANWDDMQTRLVIDGVFENKKDELVALAQGVYSPKDQFLEVDIDARIFPLNFLNRYFEGVASKFHGNGAGHLKIAGPTENLRFEGNIFVSDGGATIDLLKTTYHFEELIVLTPEKILLNNLTLKDEMNNTALLNGHIDHNGLFTDMVYDVQIQADNILALNTTAYDDDFFYGKAYVGGLVRIFGDDSEANIQVNGISRRNTKCFMSMESSSSVFESDFIQFAEKQLVQYVSDFEENKPQFANQNEFNVKVDMQIELTPEAEMEILVDPRAGDKITGRGRGNLRIRFDTFSDVELFGTVELEEGYYLFTLQTVIRKEFKINQGSTIAWTGDPFEAQVDMNAYYPLTASLSDLMEREELQQVTTRSTVPVHCLLNLTDDLMSPTIQFDINLPASDESVKSRVNNIINTDEMMNRQILYLLLFHKFYTPDYMRTTAAVGVNEGISFAAATVSAQLNSILQSILNTNIFSLGVDWQQTDALTNEFKAQILIQPNNRLVINGNIGYRNDIINETKFIGDFDLEYKLIESGKLRFTAYNHTIDRAQLREAKTTQGIGLIYREDFNNLQEMLNYYWEMAKSIFIKEEKEEENSPELTVRN